MLIPNTIPDEEPEINVGIILPEDNTSKITLTFPEHLTYNIGSKEFLLDIPPGSKVHIELFDKHYVIKTEDITVEMKGELTIESDGAETTLSKKSGIKVKPVTAGRGFHWEKNIEVSLPDILIIRPVSGNIVLINQLPLEHYVMCVATSEMSAHCPEQLIESQTIAARSWLLANVEHKHIALGMDVCNDDCCQRYQGTTFLSRHSIGGALNTYGKVLMYDNKICDARYSKSCGGISEASQNIWPGQEYPYLPVKMDAAENKDIPDINDENQLDKWIHTVPDTFCSSENINESKLSIYLGNVDEDGVYFRWQVILSQNDIIKSLNKYARIVAIEIDKLEIISRGGSGRINKLNVHYIDMSNKKHILEINSEYNVRRLLSDKFLYSSAFIIKPVFRTQNNVADEFILSGAGWGHGVGMCQIGALGMAMNGYSTEEILNHYYPGSHIEKIY